MCQFLNNTVIGLRRFCTLFYLGFTELLQSKRLIVLVKFVKTSGEKKDVKDLKDWRHISVVDECNAFRNYYAKHKNENY